MTTSLAPSIPVDGIHRSIGERYALERELGRGGMGTVYLARDLKLDRPVALKILLPDVATRAGLRDRFVLETRTAASFSHPNIVPVYAVEEGPDFLAYAMGLVEGETLSQRVARAGPLTAREVARMMQDVAYALAYAHGRSVVHRDIKPDNVMLERATGRALVMDFGIARSMHAADASAALTRVGEVVGTPEYMSPEQAAGDVVDGRSDLYALGLTAYFAATGEVVMSGESTQKVLVRQLTEPVAPLLDARPDFPPVLARAIDRCVEKDPAQRFPTAEALVDQLDAARLAEPDIPLPIRLFAGELSSLGLTTVAALVVVALVAQAQRRSAVSSADAMLPIAGLLAIVATRIMATMAERRRLAESGFTPDDVARGLSRVVDERAARRAELRGQPLARRRRRRWIVVGAVMLGAALAMVGVALSMRVLVSPGIYHSPPVAVRLSVSGFALLGTGLVLLLRSPFRMPVSEAAFRMLWLGPLGRGATWLSTRRVRRAPPRNGPPGTGSPDGASSARVASRAAAPATDALADLTRRVAQLERWRRTLE